MNTKKTLALTYRYSIMHLFPFSKGYRKLEDELEMKEGTFSSFLLSLRKKEGRKALAAADTAFALLSIIIAAALDFHTPLRNIIEECFVLFSLVYALLLSIKFGFIKVDSFKNCGEMIFSVLSLLFAHSFLLTFLLVLLFENAEALSYGEAY